MHKSWIAGAAVVASVALVMILLFATPAPERSQLPSQAVPPAPVGSAPATPVPVEEPSAPAPKLAVPDEASSAPAPRAAARVEKPSARAAPRAPLIAGAVRFCGRVEAPDGSPAADAGAVLFSNISGEPAKLPLARGRCDAGGAFCIDVEEPNEFILLLCAAGSEPLTRLLARPRQPETDLGAMRLSRGESITGRVSCEGEPLPRAEIAAVLDWPLETFALDDAFVKWIHGRFEWSFAIADSKPDGTYAISGLGKEAYKVRISSLRGRQAVLGFQQSANREVHAPAEGVDFALDAATQRFTFRYENRPMGGVEAQLESDGAHLNATSDADGLCSFKVRPRLEANLIASLSGFKVVRLPITAPSAGEERAQVVELEVFHPPAALVFDLVAPDDARVQRARFAFYGSEAGDGKPTFVQDIDLKSPQRTHAPRNSGPHEEFVAPGIPAGVYRIVVQAGELLGYASTPLGNVPYCEYCDAEAVVSVPATGEVRRSIHLVPRATAQIAAHDRTGRGLPARARLFDTRGAALEMSLAARKNGIWQTLTALDENDYTTVRSTLCSGPADIELSCPGYRPKRVKLAFEGQHALPIDVTLDAE
jgi:hypothetical protein